MICLLFPLYTFNTLSLQPVNKQNFSHQTELIIIIIIVVIIIIIVIIVIIIVIIVVIVIVVTVVTVVNVVIVVIVVVVVVVIMRFEAFLRGWQSALNCGFSCGFSLWSSHTCVQGSTCDQPGRIPGHSPSWPVIEPRSQGRQTYIATSIIYTHSYSQVLSPYSGIKLMPDLQNKITHWVTFTIMNTLSTHPEPAWLKMAQSPLNDTKQPVDINEEGLHSISEIKVMGHWSNHGQTMAGKTMVILFPSKRDYGTELMVTRRQYFTSAIHLSGIGNGTLKLKLIKVKDVPAVQAG